MNVGMKSVGPKSGGYRRSCLSVDAKIHILPTIEDCGDCVSDPLLVAAL